MEKRLLLARTGLAVLATVALFVVAVWLWWHGLSLARDNLLVGSAVTVVAGIVAILLVAAVMDVRALGRRWNSPMYYPAIWTVILAPLAARVLYGLFGQPWLVKDSTCFRNSCTTSSHFDLASLIFGIVFSGIFLFPFGHAVTRLYVASRVPRARFVSRRRRIHV